MQEHFAGYCRMCGSEHITYLHKFWCPDDGWRHGALCPSCWDEVKADRPAPDDYAYPDTFAEIETDLDILEAM